MTIFWIAIVLVAVASVCVGGYYFNNTGPGDNARDPNVKQRRNNWVP